ncbi:MAG: malate synthase G, partial [Porticoccaceae bacterium]
MTERVQQGGLHVARVLDDLVRTEILPGLGIEPATFWAGFASLLTDLAPENARLLALRDDFQQRIDAWHRERASQPHDPAAYKAFLTEIGYLLPERDDFAVTTQNVDAEIATIAGPQLVVPITNARYALNAANARWGSLYDALYGNDVIPETDGAVRGPGYNPVRGAKVIAYAREFLDASAPLSAGSHADAVGYRIVNNALAIRLDSGATTGLKTPAQWVGYQGNPDSPDCVLLKNNGLHVEIQFDPDHYVGRDDPAHIKDLYLESAITTIQDCEDSVAAVDAGDKCLAYRNWLGLIRGDLEEVIPKGDRLLRRTLNPDREYLDPNGSAFSVPGRSLLLVRNVGHLMTTDAVLDAAGKPVPEGMLDALITGAVAAHDLRGLGRFRNSRAGSVYIVKPKMHGPDEVAFTVRLFAR